jgi:ABC-type dipeptide/oligopeptide/nickel transport system permease subunit
MLLFPSLALLTTLLALYSLGDALRRKIGVKGN